MPNTGLPRDHSAVGVYRWAWWGLLDVLVLMATIGLDLQPLFGVIMSALLVGLISSWVCSGYAKARERTTRRSRLAVVGAAAAGLTILCNGLASLFGGLGVLLTVLLVVTSPPLMRRVLTKLGVPEQLPRPDPPPAPPDPPHRVGCRRGRREGLTESQVPGAAERPPSSSPPQPPTVASLTDSELCMAWRHSYLQLQRTQGAARLRVIQQRQAHLDEMTRRSPIGVDNWLAAGARAASDPAKFILPSKPAGQRPVDSD